MPNAAVLIASCRLISPPMPAPLVELRGGERGDTGSSSPLLLNIEHGAERDVPLLCIARFSPNLSAGCYIVLIVEREIGNPQVRKDFPNG